MAQQSAFVEEVERPCFSGLKIKGISPQLAHVYTVAHSRSVANTSGVTSAVGERFESVCQALAADTTSLANSNSACKPNTA